MENKNAFQWDAYRPLVDRMPTCTGQEGVSTQGVFARGAGVSVFGPGGAETPPVDRQTPVKT